MRIEHRQAEVFPDVGDNREEGRPVLRLAVDEEQQVEVGQGMRAAAICTGRALPRVR